MPTWPTGYQPFGPNRHPLLIGLSSTDAKTPIPVGVDPATGAIITEGGGGSGGTTVITDGVTGTIKATVAQLTNSNPQAVEIVDGSGNQITSFGGGTQYTQGQSVTTPTGSVALGYDGTNVRAMKTDSSGDGYTIITNGTNTADVVAGDTGFNGVAMASATKTYTFTTSASGAQTILANTPCEGFSWVEVVYTSVGTGLGITGGQFSATNSGTFVNSPDFVSPGNSVGSLGTSLGILYNGPIHGNYFQIAVSALTSGTFSGTVTFKTLPIGTNNTKVTQGGVWTVGSNSATGSAVPSNGFYIAGLNSGNLLGIAVVNSSLDGQTLANSLAVKNYNSVYNGTNWDLSRTATAAGNTTGTGLLGVGNLGYDGTNWQTIGAPLQTTTTSNTAQGMMLVGSGVQSNTFSVTSVSSGTTYDVGNFASVKVQITSQYTGTTPTITFQGSDDGTNWFTHSLPNSTGSGGVANSTTSTGLWYGSLKSRYFRLNFSGTYASGTAAGLIVFSTGTASSDQTSAAQAGTWNVGSSSATGSAVPANAFYIGLSNASGNLIGLASAASSGYSAANGGSILPIMQYANNNSGVNSSTADAIRNNTSVVVVAAGQTSTTTQTVTTYNARSLLLAVNIASGAGTVTVAISGSTVSGYTYPILTSTALTGVADNTLRVFPGATPAANTAANDILPRTLSITYTVVGTIAFGSDAVLSV